MSERALYEELLTRQGYTIKGDYAILETPGFGIWIQRIVETKLPSGSVFSLSTDKPAEIPA